jgi:acyl-coenzyme A synthetase/AMP-(fatty) acid ligase
MPTLLRLIDRASGHDRVVATRDYVVPLADFAWGASLGSHPSDLAGRSVLLCIGDMAKTAAALIDLDGCARRIVLCPLGLDHASLAAAAQDAEVDALVYDDERVAPSISVGVAVPCGLPLRPLRSPRVEAHETEWILPTSGTSGPPKLVVHTLRTLIGAIADAPLQQWATFYDIRRYGGLQIFLRALAGRGSLHLTGAVEGVGGALSRFAVAGITHISGTPSQWRNVLMSGEGRRIDPDYIRLSGEIADDAVLRALRALYPRARIEHAYASTEAGVVFAVDDGRSGFPASWLERDEPVQVRIVDGTLCVRSDRRALRFLGATSLPITDGDGFVDTGDQVEQHDGRLYFVGRRGGVINVGGAKVHPEEVEAVLNAHAAVHASRAYARKNPVTGAVVFAEVVLRDERAAHAECEREILAACRAQLPRHMAPAGLRFVANLPITDGGKLFRHG